MRFQPLFITALLAIWTNKSRSILTMLGVIIGVLSVILLLAIGNGLQAYITEQFDALGANTVIIAPGQVFTEEGGFRNPDNQISDYATSQLSFDDWREIKKLREYVVDAFVEFTGGADVTYKQETKKDNPIYAVSGAYKEVRNTDLEKGDFFSEEDVEARRRVAVLGNGLATDLFGNVDPIGKRIQISSVSFEVVGVAEEVGGSFGGPSFDDYVYMPITAAHDLFDTGQILGITVKVKGQDSIDPAIEAIEEVLLTRLQEDEFSVFDQSQILDTINNILGILTAGLGGIAAISLLVGGIGIMNIMLVSVTERTREIGLRKAVGATPKVILVQFLIESSTLSVLGGMIGVALGFGISLLMQAFFPAKVTLWSVLLAFGVSAIVGIVFGVLPARKASKLSPIEALRYE